MIVRNFLPPWAGIGHARLTLKRIEVLKEYLRGHEPRLVLSTSTVVHSARMICFSGGLRGAEHNPQLGFTGRCAPVHKPVVFRAT